MKKPCIVGIAGGSASGKTTIVNKLKASFGDNILVISHDSYYKAHNDLSYDERTRLNYDHPDSFDTDLMIRDIAKLSNGEEADIPVYDFSIHNRTERARTIDSIINQYQQTVKPMHEQFVEPSKKYADIIIPRGGENSTGITILTEHIKHKLSV